MSLKAMHHVWEDETIASRLELLVLLAIADHANDDMEAFPGIEHLSRKTRSGCRAVQEAISRLVEQKKLSVKLNAGPHKTNLYRILCPPPQKMHPAATRGLSANNLRIIREQMHPNHQESSGTVINRQEILLALPEAEASKKFQKPSLEEAKSYAIEIELPSTEAEQCFDYYESKGWKVGKSPMKDWRAAMRRWKRTWESPSRPLTTLPPSAAEPRPMTTEEILAECCR